LIKIKQCRRVATRYDKLAANYLAFIKLTSIRIWLRANESTPEVSLYLKFNRKRGLADRRAQLRTKPPASISLPRPDDEPSVDNPSVCFAATLTFVSEIVGEKVAIELHDVLLSCSKSVPPRHLPIIAPGQGSFLPKPNSGTGSETEGILKLR
jgi:hypothetical protein